MGEALLAAAGREPDASAADALGTLLVAAHREGQAHWSVALDALVFARYLGERVEGDDLAADVAGLHTQDLLLSCACVDGDDAAIRAFEREYMSTVPAMVSRLQPPATVVDDMRQNLRDRLLVASGDRPPAIARYAGRGALAGWLKVVAVRETMALLKRRGPEAADDEVALLSAPGHDPEFDLMRDRYGDAFRAAFKTALLALSPRDRDVLRGHLVERLSIDQIGSLHGVHRATAARWLVSIRDGLYEATTAELTRKLDIEPAECESILRLIRSQLHVTVGRHLA